MRLTRTARGDRIKQKGDDEMIIRRIGLAVCLFSAAYTASAGYTWSSSKPAASTHGYTWSSSKPAASTHGYTWSSSKPAAETHGYSWSE
jgi:hypothetical protein